ncbi:hypothetical protein DGG96_07310 [Legionella qingyii]|uniref:Uncharacterized protein n=1 Tax=Legionella qingyii TaxID=2184757 RepID=A0A317U2N3_9GAMM|nr:hypothetical protein DGG96_07310 [Legionella qingyii]
MRVELTKIVLERKIWLRFENENARSKTLLNSPPTRLALFQKKEKVSFGDGIADKSQLFSYRVTQVIVHVELSPQGLVIPALSVLDFYNVELHLVLVEADLIFVFEIEVL